MDSFDEALSRLQEFIRKRPSLLVGTGLSISMGLPGMGELTEFLKAEIPKQCCENRNMQKEWETCIGLIEEHGLEDGLGKVQVTTELLELIIETTATLVDINDAELRKKIVTESLDSFPIAALIRHLVNSLPVDQPCLDIITSNYDHIIEYACDYYGIHCCTGFVGSYIQRFSKDSLVESIHIPVLVPNRGKTTIEYRKRRQVKLMKPHGSLKWQQVNDRIIQCSEPLIAATRVIITPGLTKYKASLTDPVMNCHRETANLSLRKANAIIVIGYGFNDSHLQTVLIERLEQGLDCLILTRSLTENAKSIVAKFPHVIALEKSEDDNTRWYYGSKSGELPGSLWNIGYFVKTIIE